MKIIVYRALGAYSLKRISKMVYAKRVFIFVEIRCLDNSDTSRFFCEFDCTIIVKNN